MTMCHTVINGQRCRRPNGHIERQRDHLTFEADGVKYYRYNYRGSADVAVVEAPKKASFFSFGPGWRDKWLAKMPWSSRTHRMMGEVKVAEKHMNKHEYRQMKKNKKRVRNVVKPTEAVKDAQ